MTQQMKTNGKPKITRCCVCISLKLIVLLAFLDLASSLKGEDELPQPIDSGRTDWGLSHDQATRMSQLQRVS